MNLTLLLLGIKIYLIKKRFFGLVVEAVQIWSLMIQLQFTVKNKEIYV